MCVYIRLPQGVVGNEPHHLPRGVPKQEKMEPLAAAVDRPLSLLRCYPLFFTGLAYRAFPIAPPPPLRSRRAPQVTAEGRGICFFSLGERSKREEEQARANDPPTLRSHASPSAQAGDGARKRRPQQQLLLLLLSGLALDRLHCAALALLVPV